MYFYRKCVLRRINENVKNVEVKINSSSHSNKDHFKICTYKVKKQIKMANMKIESKCDLVLKKGFHSKVTSF